jgi:hypothetical protein
MRLITFLCIIAAALPGVAAAQGNVQWNDFPPAQSRLSFDAPGLSGQPNKAQEGIWIGEGKNNVRRFAYFFSPSVKDGSYAIVIVFSVNADATYFVEAPAFDSLITTFFADFRDKSVTWDDAAKQTVMTPIGATGYRRFTGKGRSCVSFGGLYGQSSALPFAHGVSMTSGSEQIFGFYCVAKGHRLSVGHIELVLSRLGFDGLGKPQQPAPSNFAAVNQAQPATADASQTEGEVRRAVALVWEGHPGPIDASLIFDPKAAVSRLNVILPGEAKPCTGIAQMTKDYAGTWSVQCPSGAHAGGSFRGLGRGKGSMGEGQDNKGAKIAFTVAGD